MCGYIRRVTDSPAVGDMLDQIGLGHLAGNFSDDSPDELAHFYPAFGGNPNRKITNLIVPGVDGPTTVDATWWFDAEPEGDTLRLGSRTTFNARNLNAPYWKGALKHHRALVVATGLGESNWVDGKKTQYLMEGERPFLLGALFRPYDNGCYSCAIITRDSHPRFDQYHDKAFPCFIPPAADFVDQWLNVQGEVPSQIANYLEHPQIVVPLHVEAVKAFKHARLGAEAEVLPADPV